MLSPGQCNETRLCSQPGFGQPLITSHSNITEMVPRPPRTDSVPAEAVILLLNAVLLYAVNGSDISMRLAQTQPPGCPPGPAPKATMTLFQTALVY